MKKLFWLGTVVLTFAALAASQDKVFQWVKASEESAQLDPLDYHAGRVYHAAPDGGNMHIDVQANLPVTVAVAPDDQ